MKKVNEVFFGEHGLTLGSGREQWIYRSEPMCQGCFQPYFLTVLE